MDKITVGIIGIGGYGALTLEDIFAALDGGRDDFEIVASVDPYPQGSKHFERLREMGVPHFETVNKMYDPHTVPYRTDLLLPFPLLQRPLRKAHDRRYKRLLDA